MLMVSMQLNCQPPCPPYPLFLFFSIARPLIFWKHRILMLILYINASSCAYSFKNRGACIQGRELLWFCAAWLVFLRFCMARRPCNNAKQLPPLGFTSTSKFTFCNHHQFSWSHASLKRSNSSCKTVQLYVCRNQLWVNWAFLFLFFSLLQVSSS